MSHVKNHLTAHQKDQARRKMVRSSLLVVQNAPKIHYTQSPARWSGINEHKRAYKGQFPVQADCSSMATWIYWDALLKHIRRGEVGDIVNDADWRGGYTGTMLSNGRSIGDVPREIGDLVIYGRGGSGSHVALYVGRGKVVSHGSEPGPFLLPYDYREDIQDVRRYL